MKKGFTMIELIFVIVILGILAAVAIPKLAATRDDAEVSKFCSNAATAVSDIGAYYTAKGKFATTLTDMTNVGPFNTNNLQAKGVDCATFTISDADGNLTVAHNAGGGICTQIQNACGTSLYKTYSFGGSSISFTGN